MLCFALSGGLVVGSYGWSVGGGVSLCCGMLALVWLDVLVGGLWFRQWLASLWCAVGFGLGFPFCAWWLCVGVVVWGPSALGVGVAPHVLHHGLVPVFSCRLRWFRGGSLLFGVGCVSWCGLPLSPVRGWLVVLVPAAESLVGRTAVFGGVLCILVAAVWCWLCRAGVLVACVCWFRGGVWGSVLISWPVGLWRTAGLGVEFLWAVGAVWPGVGGVLCCIVVGCCMVVVF